MNITPTRPRLLPIVPLVLTILSSCGVQTSGTEINNPRSLSRRTLVSDDFGSTTTDLLQALQGRVPGLLIRTAVSGCPRVSFRGTRSLQGENSAVVYVDGARAADTCVLSMLNVDDVERVEAYPSGATPRVPYQAHPNGLILVFLQRAGGSASPP